MMAFIMHSINIGLDVLFYQGTIEETRALIERRRQMKLCSLASATPLLRDGSEY